MLLKGIAACVLWTASGLAGLFIWYQLDSTSRAMAWGLIGIMLLEWGLWRRSVHPRLQGYAALAAGFVYIFLANLDRNAVSSTRMWVTVLPLVIMLYYAYHRLHQSRNEAFVGLDQRLRAGNWMAWMAGLALASLIRSAIVEPWVLAVWTLLLLALLAMATMLQRAIFLDHSMVLLVGMMYRGVLWNLWDTTAAFVQVRELVVLGTAVGLLLGLFFAYRIREWQEAADRDSLLWAWFRPLARHPEQALFYSALILVSGVIYYQPHGWFTLLLGVEGLAAFIFALWVKERSFRLAGLFVLLAAVGKLVFYDMWQLPPTDRWATGIAVGVAVIAMAFLYNKFSERIKAWL